MSGTLYFGDNLDVLREHVRDESVDLIYLDPPFNSAASYNVLFKTTDGKKSQSQITAFEDTWHWSESSELAFDETMRSGRTTVANVLRALRQCLGENDVMAYLAMMTVRLIELSRALRPSGSIYLHCDPTASHYLKVIMDSIFAPHNFQNEVIWKRHSAHNSTKRYGPIHDTLLFYSKGSKFTWNPVRLDYDPEYLDKYYKYDDGDGRLYWRNSITAAGTRNGSSGRVWKGFDPTSNGSHWKFTTENLDTLDASGKIYWPSNGGWPQIKRYRDELKGLSVSDVWDDIDKINPAGKERLGYPTQKPVALLDRIISASSNSGELVLDPFCGCGTTVHAAQKNNRRWIGIDITPIAVNLISRRLKEAFAGVDFNVRGIPRDMDGARELAFRDKHLFQLWACDLVDAQPFRDGKKGADGGIDGLIYFKPDGKTTKAAVVSVKGGAHVERAHIGQLRGTMERLGEPMGIFVTLTPPTAPMVKEAASAGLYDTGTHRVPRIQILTAEQLLAGEKPRLPFGHNTSYRKADREKDKGAQFGLEI